MNSSKQECPRWFAPFAVAALGFFLSAPSFAAPPLPKAPPPPAASTAAPAAAPPPPAPAATPPATPPAAPTATGQTPPAAGSPATPPALDAPPPPPPAEGEPAEPAEEAPKPKKKKNKKSTSGEDARPWDNSQPMPTAPPPMMGWGAEPDPNLPVLPRRIEWEEGDILLPGYELKTKPDRSLLIGGLVTLVVPYGLSFLGGGLVLADGNDSEIEEFAPLLIPVIGPFITLAQDQSSKEGYKFIMLANGFGQVAGAAMIAAGIFVPEKYLERAASLPGKPELLFGGTSAAVKFHF